MQKIILSTLMLLAACQVFGQKILTEKDVQKLYQQMQGFYSSKEQADNDSDYYDIRLKMVPMWKDREGLWLYVEQAMSTTEDKPYRQRVYQLSLLNDSTIESKVYTIKQGDKYYGSWNKRKPLDTLPFDSLEVRKGCSIFLHKKDNRIFSGSTHQSDCESNLRGATYATSEVVITDEMLKSWDRGFDNNNKQVWGAVKGAYQFIKMDAE